MSKTNEHIMIREYNMALSKKFQVRLYDLIDDIGCTRKELSTLSGVSTGTISYSLTYGIIPSTGILVKLADFFDVSIYYLLGETDENDFVKSENPVSFAERFDGLCAELGITHYRVSKDCAFDPSIISKWISKGYLPELDILERLCEKLEVSPDYLLGRTDYRK